ncbi:hypothetical protein COPR103792_02565 [Corynebacterium propinquum]|uniref:hypothetical protein n=1 Tax=Corynebacterium propinquum TaxID=43769 RepID=UPI0006654832|nr:hypothetical protein [Corynebacterium propinquum]QQU90623.1 hypothetical protein I6I69_10495 [Corynebacterium propinquum]
MSIENWVSVLSAGIALASFVLASWNAMQSRKSEEKSAQQAKEATLAAKAAAKYQSEIAKALSKLEPKNGAPWEIKLDKGKSYILTNISGKILQNVHIEIGDLSRINGGDRRLKVGPGEQISFIYGAIFGSNNPYQLHISYEAQDEEGRQEWTGVTPRPENFK